MTGISSAWIDAFDLGFFAPFIFVFAGFREPFELAFGTLFTAFFFATLGVFLLPGDFERFFFAPVPFDGVGLFPFVVLLAFFFNGTFFFGAFFTRVFLAFFTPPDETFLTLLFLRAPAEGGFFVRVGGLPASFFFFATIRSNHVQAKKTNGEN